MPTPVGSPVIAVNLNATPGEVKAPAELGNPKPENRTASAIRCGFPGAAAYTTLAHRVIPVGRYSFWTS